MEKVSPGPPWTMIGTFSSYDEASKRVALLSKNEALDFKIRRRNDGTYDVKSRDKGLRGVGCEVSTNV